MIAPLLAIIFACFVCELPSASEIKSDLSDPYFEREFDWAMYIDAHDLKNYLNYPDSQLRPLTNVRINFRSLPRGNSRARLTPAKIYEDFWYHDGMPVGLKRYTQLNIAPNKFGIVVIGQLENKPDHALSIVNALVRLILDLQMKQISTSVVVVPAEQYQQLSDDLGRYGFFPFVKVMDGQQITVHLRSYPQGRDQYYFFQKGY